MPAKNPEHAAIGCRSRPLGRDHTRQALSPGPLVALPARRQSWTRVRDRASGSDSVFQGLADRFDVVLIEIRLHDLGAQGLYDSAKVSDRRLLADED
jgi:hypothetical protein